MDVTLTTDEELLKIIYKFVAVSKKEKDIKNWGTKKTRETRESRWRKSSDALCVMRIVYVN